VATDGEETSRPADEIDVSAESGAGGGICGFETRKVDNRERGRGHEGNLGFSGRRDQAEPKTTAFREFARARPLGKEAHTGPDVGVSASLSANIL
jgi:hypothetical protein